jgi:hypothetical protein
MKVLFFAWVIFSHGWILMAKFNSKFSLHVWSLYKKNLTCYFFVLLLIVGLQVMFYCSKMHHLPNYHCHVGRCMIECFIIVTKQCFFLGYSLFKCIWWLIYSKIY